MPGCSKLVAPLSDLLKKAIPWSWEPHHQEAFEELEEIMLDLVLLLDLSKSFKVHIDASNQAIRGVLVQCGYLVAFDNHKLKNIERCYSMHEKELQVVVHCLCGLPIWWRASLWYALTM